MSHTITDQDYALIATYLAGEATPEERRALEAWRAAHPENERAMHEVETIYRDARLPDAPAFDREGEWRRLAERLALAPLSPTGHPSASRRIPPMIRVAAAVLILAAATLLLTRPWQSAEPRSWQAPRGTQATLTLPDGSKVLLNSDSRLRYAPSATERVAHIDGEAFFDIVPEDRPFVVAGDNGRVVVLGTRFSVQSRDGATRVVVAEGRVALYGDDGGSEPLNVAAGEMAALSPAGPSGLSRPADPALLAWVEGDLGFYQTPLTDVAAELSRRYDRTVIVAVDSPDVHTLTGTFARQPIEKILTSICLATGLEYILEDGEIHIVSR